MPSTGIDNLTYEYNRKLERVNSNTSSLLLKEEEISDAVNYYWSQNGLRARLGGKNFKTKTQFNGEDVVHMNIYSRPQDDFFYFIVGTTGGYLFFIKLSLTTGATTQTAVTDLSLGTDYPTDTYFFDASDLVATLERLDDFQYAIFRSPTASQVSGSPDYWDLEPALDTSTGFIETFVFNNILYIIDGTENLYKFDGTLTSGNKIAAVTDINSKSEVTSSTEFKKLGSKFTRLIVVDEDYVHGSAVGDGDSFSGLGSEELTLRIGRLEGTKIKDFAPIKNGGVITSQNETTKVYNTKLLTSDGTTASIRIDEVDDRAGIIGKSAVPVNQEMIALTNYGFIALKSLGSNERFGLTDQKSISKDINNKIKRNLNPSLVNATYYSNDKNWYLCQISDDLVACLSLDYSETQSTLFSNEAYKWTTFLYPGGLKQIKSLFNYLFIVDSDNNIVMSDVPAVYKDSGTAYLKRIVSRSFGSGEDAAFGEGTDKEGRNYEKSLKKVKVNGIVRDLSDQSLTVTAIKSSGLSGVQNIKKDADFSFTLATGLDLGPAADAFDLSDDVDLFQREESPAFYQAKDVGLTSRTFQVQIDSVDDLDFEVLDIAVGYTINKEAKSDV